MKLDGILQGEDILPDDYPVYIGYFYLCDGVVKSSPVNGRVKGLKNVLKVNEVRNCLIVDRGFYNE